MRRSWVTRDGHLAWLAVALLAAGPGLARAQWQTIRHYVVRDGLAQSQVTALHEDPRGYLWIATLSGLSRFDGRRFATFTSLEGLPDDFVTSLASDSRGDVLLGTDSGNAARIAAGRVSIIRLHQEPAPPVVAVAALDGEALLGSRSGLHAVSPDGVQRTILSEPVREVTGSRDGTLLALADDLWEVSSDGSARSAGFAIADPRRIGAIGRSELGWLAVLDDGTVVAGDSPGGWRTIARTGLRGVTTVVATRQGDLWLGNPAGLWHVSPGTERRRLQLRQGADTFEVRALLEDREGNLWVGTWGDGLYQLASRSFTVVNRSLGLPSETVWAFLEESHGCTWLATEDEGVLRWCDGSIAEQLRPGAGLPVGRAMALARDHGGRLWIGTAGGLVRRGTGGRLTVFTVADGLPDNYVRSISVDRNDRVWAATAGGLARIDAAGIRSWTADDGMPDSNLRAVVVDRTGVVWLASHSAGVIRFDGRSFEAFGVEENLPHKRVWCLFIDSRDLIWAGTDAGIWTRPLTGGPSRTIVARDGLPSHNVLSLIEDGEGTIWSGTTRGVARISPVGEVLQTLTADDGLSGSEANEGAAMLAGDGRVWLGLVGGITVIDPDRLKFDPHPPRLVIEGMTVDGEPWGSPFPIASGLPSPEPFLHLPPGARAVRFDFVGLNLTAPSKVRYRFHLEGHDRGPGVVTEDTHVNYRALPPRRYRFVLEARNRDGVWTPEPLSVTFTVSPMWYRSTWFLAVVILGSVASAAAAVYRSLRRQRKRQRVLEQQVMRRTAELNTAYRRIAEQNTLLQDLSRTDPLTGLRNRRVLEEQLPTEMAVLRREMMRRQAGEPADHHGAVVYLLDLDDFKQINDAHGHHLGDRLLIEIARSIEEKLREEDLAVRWGGDEFVVLARGVDSAGALHFGRRLLTAVAETHVNHEGSTIRVTASVGFIPYPFSTGGFIPTERWHRLIEAADRLMYLSKVAGGGRACGIQRARGRSLPDDETATIELILSSPEQPPPGIDLVTTSAGDREIPG